MPPTPTPTISSVAHTEQSEIGLTSGSSATHDRTGLLYGAIAYLSWGTFPLYWPLLRPATPLEILAHRIVWSLVAVAVILVALRRLDTLRAIVRQRRTMGLLALAGVIIAGNWGLYIFAVNTGHVVESALGYFITPLMSVTLGVLVLRERLRPAQWAAVAIGAISVLVLSADYGRVPWIALALATSFTTYGLIKKKAAAPPLPGLVVENATMTLPAMAFLLWLGASDDLAFGSVSIGHTSLILGAGIITTIPLLFFAGAANRIPLSMIGLLQYLAPILQFIIGITFFGEDMPPARWFGFALIWLALTIFTVDTIRAGRLNSVAANEVDESSPLSTHVEPIRR